MDHAKVPPTEFAWRNDPLGSPALGAPGRQDPASPA